MADRPRDRLADVITNDFLCCQICLGEFVNPKVLPCLHNFCLKCLEEYVGYGKSKLGTKFACPICRNVTTVPKTGLAGLKNNFYIDGLKDAVHKESTPPQDNVVGEDTRQENTRNKEGRNVSFLNDIDSRIVSLCKDIDEKEKAVFFVVDHMARLTESEKIAHRRIAGEKDALVDKINSHAQSLHNEVEDSSRLQMAVFQEMKSSIEEEIWVLRKTASELEDRTNDDGTNALREVDIQEVKDEASKQENKTMVSRLLYVNTNPTISLSNPTFATIVTKSEIVRLSGSAETEIKPTKFNAISNFLSKLFGRATPVEMSTSKQPSEGSPVVTYQANQEAGMVQSETSIETTNETIYDTCCVPTGLAKLEEPSEGDVLEQPNTASLLNGSVPRKGLDKKKPRTKPMTPRPRMSNFAESENATAKETQVVNNQRSRPVEGQKPQHTHSLSPHTDAQHSRNTSRVPNYKFVCKSVFNTRTEDDKRLPCPTGIAVHPNTGNIIVADSGNDKLKIFTPDGVLKAELCSNITLQLKKPWNVKIARILGRQNVVVTLVDELVILTPQKQILAKYTIPECKGLDIGPEGHMVVSCGQQGVIVLSSEGRPLGQIISDSNGMPFFSMAWYVVVTPQGHVVVSDYDKHCVFFFDNAGKLITTYGGEKGSGDGQVNRPQGLCVDRDGNVMVADQNNDRIHLVSPQGRFIQIVLTKDDGLKRPQALAISPSGDLVVTQFHGNVAIFGRS